jgi:hypothetical protein
LGKQNFHISVTELTRPGPKLHCVMKANGLTTFMARVDAAEYGLCRRLNRGAEFALARRLFRIASRLGNGMVWYLLIVSLPLLYGPAAV